MHPPATLSATPWDAAVYGLQTHEIAEASPEALRYAAAHPGHYTAKVDPLASKALLHDLGFYYCDTLIEPYCRARDLIDYPDEQVSIARDVDLDAALAIGHGAFRHDRFHRDFNLDPALADARYDRWLRDLHAQGAVHGLLHGGELAGFIALVGNRMALHALAGRFRGRGLAKRLWSAACREFFARPGIDELESSVSAANLAVMNLYASLGFRFRNASDVYHLLVR